LLAGANNPEDKRNLASIGVPNPELGDEKDGGLFFTGQRPRPLRPALLMKLSKLTTTW
jgi:hypothetical protein